MTDEQRKTQIAALVNELGGYQRRREDAEKSQAEGEVARMDKRIENVESELKRLRDSGKPKSQRATRAA